MAADESRVVSIMEISEIRQVVTEESNQTSRGINGRPVSVSSEQERLNGVITEGVRSRSSHNSIQDWLISIMMDGGEEQQTSQYQIEPRIQKVPKMLREIESNKQHYDPVIISIGPYHHGKPELEAAEKLKDTTARQFVSGSDKSIEIFYNKIVKVVSNAREWYAEGSTTDLNDEKFARMMFLDGCFVLHFIDCLMNNKRELLKMRCHHIPFVVRDMFLLENQLPFLVLGELISLRFPKNEGDDMIKRFIRQQSRPPGSPYVHGATVKNKQPLHLLSLLRTELIGSCSMTDKPNGSDWHSFRSVKELQAVGIIFKRSRSYSLTDISFKSHKVFGELSLPPIAIDDITMPKFLNLIAYEMCPDAPADYAVTSYVCFLDALIDSPDDVKHLRSKSILLNFLGSDEKVAELFNNLALNLVPDSQAYIQVKSGIEKHYKNQRRIWMTEMLHNHFSSPWTTVAFFAALFVIILTIIQTYFTIFPREK